jgi:hypothetical protein
MHGFYFSSYKSKVLLVPLPVLQIYIELGSRSFVNLDPEINLKNIQFNSKMYKKFLGLHVKNL